MTEEILQSDIDLARKRIKAGEGDAEIIRALELRQIASWRAAKLVDDLRTGRTVEPDHPSPSTPVERARRHSTSSSIGASKRHHEDQPARPTPWFAILSILSVVLCITVIALINRRPRAGTPNQSKHTGSMDAGSLSSHLRAKPAAVQIHITNDDFIICGKTMTSESLPQVFAAVLGPASRTNRVDTLNQLVHAYDAYGLLVYPGKVPVKDSVIIDFEGSGGTNSATSAFSGSLKIDDTVVTRATTTHELRALQSLGLKEGTENSGIFSLKLKHLTVLFVYLKKPDELSLVEVDFQ